VQLRLPWWDPGPSPGRPASPTRPVQRPRAPPPAQAERLIQIDGRAVAVQISRHRLARRYVVRVIANGGVRLTVPRGASIAGGLAFAARQAPWIERETARQRQRAAPWTTGTRVRFRGELASLAVTGSEIVIGSERIRRSSQHDDVRMVVESHLRTLADRELPPRCLEFARQTNVTIARVAVRNQRSRWGACSSRGVITLNWRLVQMPPSVSDYILFHELMHVRQPNHSRRFWREVASVCAWWREAERWIRKHGREIL
jgi:predicted metal-dependent hydrolase